MGVLSVNLLFLGMIANEFTSIFNERAALRQRLRNSFLRALFLPRNIIIIGVTLVVVGIAINYQVIIEYVAHRTINVHWVYVLTGAFFVLLGGVTMSYAFVQKLFFMTREAVTFRKTFKKQ